MSSIAKPVYESGIISNGTWGDKLSSEQLDLIDRGKVKLYCPNPACNTEMTCCKKDDKVYYRAKQVGGHIENCEYSKQGKIRMIPALDHEGKEFDFSKLVTGGEATNKSPLKGSGVKNPINHNDPKEKEDDVTTMMDEAKAPKNLSETVQVLQVHDLEETFGGRPTKEWILDQRTYDYHCDGLENGVTKENLIVLATSASMTYQQDDQDITLKPLGFDGAKEKSVERVVIHFDNEKLYNDWKNELWNVRDSAKAKCVVIAAATWTYNEEFKVTMKNIILKYKVLKGVVNTKKAVLLKSLNKL